jgi:hypothetical protein
MNSLWLSFTAQMGMGGVVLLVGMAHPLAAQQDTLRTLTDHAMVTDTRANEPVRIFSMRLPFRIAPIPTKNEISIDQHLGNTWNPTGVLEYPEEDEPRFKFIQDYNYHPLYKDSPHRYQLYSADGVISSVAISYTRKLSPLTEVYSAINVNRLAGGGAIYHFAVSDRTVQGFHRLIGQDSAFSRLENPINRAEISFTDRDGNTFAIRNKEYFPGTLDIGFRYFWEPIKSNTTRLSFSWSAQMGIPLNRARNFLAMGSILGSAITMKVVKKYSISVAAGVAIQNDQVLRIRSSSFDFNYSKNVAGYRLMMAHLFERKNHRQFGISIELQGMNSPLATKTRVLAPVINPEDIGVKTSYVPKYWTNQNPIAVTPQRRSAKGLITASEFITLCFTYRFGEPASSPTLSLYFQEDWTSQMIGIRFSEQLSNAQDFGAGIKVIQPIFCRKKLSESK